MPLSTSFEIAAVGGGWWNGPGPEDRTGQADELGEGL